jgi:hypothetical protein
VPFIADLRQAVTVDGARGQVSTETRENLNAVTVDRQTLENLPVFDQVAAIRRAGCNFRCDFDSNDSKILREVNKMKTLATATLAAVALAGLATAQIINFDDLKPGAPPPGWTATQTGSGQAKWTVEKDDTAPSKPNVLKQSGVATYPVCLKDDTLLKDGFVEVQFKPVSGKEDQAGGVVWRARDANNYYIARANALEDNVTIYHTIKGHRTEKKRTSMKVASNQWHTLRVDFKDTRFAVSLDGAKVIEWDDATFKDAGKVGIWTKADSVTLFDNFAYGGNSR